MIQDSTAAGGFSFAHLVTGATIETQVVLALCALFSLSSWYVLAVKWRQFAIISRQRRAFARTVERARGFDERHAAMASLGESPFAEVVRETGSFIGDLKAAAQRDNVARTGLSLTQLEALQLTIEAEIGGTVEASRRMIPILAIVGATAPLLGLFGTVIGIMNAFLSIAQNGTGNIAAVAPGIADALIATAAGLGAAIPAVIGYNIFTGRAERLEGELERLAQETIGALGREGRV